MRGGAALPDFKDAPHQLMRHRTAGRLWWRAWLVRGLPRCIRVSRVRPAWLWPAVVEWRASLPGPASAETLTTGLVAQDGQDRAVHARLDGTEGVAGPAQQRLGDLHGRGAHGVLVHRPVDDVGGRGFRPTVAAGGDHGLVRGLRRQPGPDQGGHARRKGDVDVDLGQAPETAVRAHDTARESIAPAAKVQGRHGDHRWGQHAGSSSWTELR